MNNYTKIKWNNAFDSWELVTIATPGDNHCFFHAILSAFYSQYSKADYPKKLEIIKRFRKELSDILAEKTSHNTSSTHYESINNGMSMVFAEEGIQEFRLENMQKQLNSESHVSY